jgi:hypothetical protein
MLESDHSWSGFDIRLLGSRETEKRMSNPKLHENLDFRVVLLILTFAR